MQCIIIICYFVKHLNSNAKRRRNCDAFDLKFNYNCCAFLGFAFKPDSTAVIGYGVLYDGKSKTRAAGFFGMALIHTVEAFKDTALMLGRNTNTGIADRKDDIAVLVLEVNCYLTAILVIADSVVTKIIDDFIEVSADTFHHTRLTIQVKLYLFLRRRHGQRLDNLVCHIVEVNRLSGRLAILVKLRKTDNIVNKRNKSCGFVFDITNKTLCILRLYKTIFEKLCAADNGLKRCFQFV